MLMMSPPNSNVLCGHCIVIFIFALMGVKTFKDIYFYINLQRWGKVTIDQLAQ
jgi:hypothetical protein